MTAVRRDVGAAVAADRERVTADLTAAFAEDPVVRWAFPREAVRRRYARHFFAMQARRLLPFGRCWRGDGAAALWAPPGHWRESPADSLRLVAAVLPGVWRRAPLLGPGLLAVEHAHPREPHAYLATVGVRPDRTGRGLGGALLHAGLEWVDASGLPAYLESSNPRNVPLYERHGFAVTGEHRLPRGPVLTLMWRQPRGA